MQFTHLVPVTLEAERTLAAAYQAAMQDELSHMQLDVEDRVDPALQVLQLFVRVHAAWQEPATRLVVIGLDAPQALVPAHD
ncbi:MAG: hypothetical protein JWM80_2948 [Cyanobacteria bacterium RYN_339]|nr:hypothetical protein [Cyanobacteria bacterium RYN_339]